MKLSFMTLGCPTWTLDDICRKGKAMGFEGVDFRGLADTLDVTTLPAFGSGAAATRRQLADAGLAVSALSSSINVCDTEKRKANIEEARRTIGTCTGLECHNVRIFGGGKVDQVGRDKAVAAGRACVEEILALDGALDIHWLFETHDFWVKAADCRILLDSITNPAFGALWDMGHTFRVGGEKPADTWKAIGGRVGYTHVKDAVHAPGHAQAMGDGWRYVPPGQGSLPLAESVRIARAGGYEGWLNFEHEKRWIPALPEPEEMFPKFVAWARRILSDNRS